VPELPELQAHAERLSAAFGDRTLSGFRPMTFTALKTVIPSPDGLFGRPLDSVERTGKYLMLCFGADRFVVHLMQGGRLEPDVKQSAKPRGGLARWSFDDDSALLLTEMAKEKRAGVWVVAGDPAHQAPLEGLGPDALGIGRDALASALAGHKSMRVHGFLRDQRAIAGIGRRLSSEICWRAELSPFASTHKLTDDEIDRLHAALGACIDDALAFERGRDTMSSSAERPGSVYTQAGGSCPACGDTIRAVEYNAYTVNYCASCQTDGKVLADNTTSKFLK
jgi:formamidopyrimidine-DNA glycosylase